LDDGAEAGAAAVRCDEVHTFQFLVLSVRDTVTGVKPDRRLLLVLLTVAFVVGLTVLVWHGRREPGYQGKLLSEWLRAYRPIGTRTPGSQQAADAVRHIGTNALPFLVRWIEDYQNPPPWERRLLRHAMKLRPPGHKIFLETLERPEVWPAR
jgi:hypothetical protein